MVILGTILLVKSRVYRICTLDYYVQFCVDGARTLHAAILTRLATWSPCGFSVHIRSTRFLSPNLVLNSDRKLGHSRQ